MKLSRRELLTHGSIGLLAAIVAPSIVRQALLTPTQRPLSQEPKPYRFSTNTEWSSYTTATPLADLRAFHRLTKDRTYAAPDRIWYTQADYVYLQSICDQGSFWSRLKCAVQRRRI